MNKKIRIIVMTAAITVAGSGLVACNWFKNDAVKPVETAKVDNYEKEIKETDLLEKNSENDNQNLNNGEYFGEGKGYGGYIKVKVIVKDKKIAQIDVLSHLETPSFFEKAKVVIDRIINKNSLEVDGISGATLTSNGLKEAVANALNRNDFKNKDNIEKYKVKNESLKNKEKVKANVIGINEKSLKDGEYFGAARGFRGSINVKTVIKDGKINEIKVLGYNDDEEFMRKAKAVINGVLAKQNVNRVDTVSGATYSSKGLLEAISNSISKAIVNNKNPKIVLKSSSSNEKIINSNEKVINNRIEKTKDTNKMNSMNPTEHTNKDNNIIKNIHNTNLKDGEYTGSAKGFREDINAKVVVKDGKINEIKLLSHNDDEEFMKKAKAVINDVLVKQNVNGVDTVSGATYSSKGLLEAISNSISKAMINNENKESLSSKTPTDTKKEDNNEKTPVETKKEDNNKIIPIDTKKEEVNEKIDIKINKNTNDKPSKKEEGNDEVLKTGEYIGKASGLYENKYILTKVKMEKNKIKNIEVSNEESTYGDDMHPYRKIAMRIVNEILKDEDKTISDVLEYYRIVKTLSSAALKNHDVNDLVNEGQKLIGDYSKDFNKIKISNYYNSTAIEREVSGSVRKYLKSQNKGQSLDTVSGATYSAIGIVKSVKNAKDKVQNHIKIKQIKILGLNDGKYKITTYDKKGEDKKLDLSGISLEIHYMDDKIKVVPFNEFDKNNIRIIDTKTRKPVDLNITIKDLKDYNKLSIVCENSLDEERFTLYKENIDTDLMKKFEYSINNGESWIDIGSKNDFEGKLNFRQELIVDEILVGKTIKVRVISENGNIYYLNSEKEDKISPNKKDMYFNVNREDINKSKNLYSNYSINFKYNLPEEYKPTIIAEDKIINQGDEFDSLKDVKITNKKGDDFKNNVIIRSDVDTNKPGEYYVTYMVNEIRKRINVTVKEINPGKNTEIIVSDRTIKKGEKFDPKEGIKGISKTGKDITNKIMIYSKVKPNEVGEYVVSYSVSDLDKLFRKTIKVTVVD